MGEISTDLLTPDQAAQLLTISTKTLRAHVKAGEIAFIPTGRGEKRVRMGFARKDILDFIESRRKRECPSISQPKARITHTTSSSKVVAFSALQRPKPRKTP
ncbi:helix-turn-helix domain-containing protein [Shinella sp.]|uniref:helix-turn-helix domain-containing protein n=1 Tax=unclassified Shinella TaxID=2643062 RepID=UPI0039184CEA